MTLEAAVTEVIEAIEKNTLFITTCPCISCVLLREAMGVLRAEADKQAQPTSEVTE